MIFLINEMGFEKSGPLSVLRRAKGIVFAYIHTVIDYENAIKVS
jgi:hypothetical protein